MFFFSPTSFYFFCVPHWTKFYIITNRNGCGFCFFFGSHYGFHNVSRWMTWLPISLKNAAKCDKWYQLQNHLITEFLNAKGAWEQLLASDPQACRIAQCRTNIYKSRGKNKKQKKSSCLIFVFCFSSLKKRLDLDKKKTHFCSFFSLIGWMLYFFLVNGNSLLRILFSWKAFYKKKSLLGQRVRISFYIMYSRENKNPPKRDKKFKKINK